MTVVLMEHRPSGSSMVWMKTWVGVVGSLVVVGVTFSNATEMGPKNKIPDDVLFKDQAAFCEGCYALVHGRTLLLPRMSMNVG